MISSSNVKVERKGTGGVMGMTKRYLQVSHPLSLEASKSKADTSTRHGITHMSTMRVIGLYRVCNL
jgi:hypothetical protein